MSFTSPKSPPKSPGKLAEREIPERFRLLLKSRQAIQKSLSSSQMKQIQKVFERLEEAGDASSLLKILSAPRFPSVLSRLAPHCSLLTL